MRGPHLLKDNPMREQFIRAIFDTGLSKRQIASRAGLSTTTVGKLLNQEHSGHIDTWYKILNACGIQVGTRIESETTIKRINKYTIEVNGHLVRADPHQEASIRGMNKEQIQNFLAVMGKR